MLREEEDELRETDELLLREAEELLVLLLRETELELLREPLVLPVEVLSPRFAGALLPDEAWLREVVVCELREPLSPLRATRVFALSKVRRLLL